MSGRVLLITDNLEMGRVWTYALGQKAVEAVIASSFEEAIERWTLETFDLLVIDVYTAQFDAMDVCRRLRAEAANPVLLLIQGQEPGHVLEAYDAGVDECIVKPIDPSVFVAKVRAWLRRSWTIPAEALDALQAGDLRLDPGRREIVTADGAVVKLTNLEFRLLQLLMSHRGQVLETGVIVDRVWGYSGGGDSILLKNVVYRLRRKIEVDPSQPRYIRAVAGEGYTFLPD